MKYVECVPLVEW